MNRRADKPGFTLIELMIVIAVIAIIAAIAIPSILAAVRAANERNASGSMKQLHAVQLAFRTSDTDGNGHQDFWVSDIAGLYYQSASSPVTATNIARMIELSLAQADGNTASPTYEIPGNPATAHRSAVKAGYWYFVLTDFEDGDATPSTYSANDNDTFGFAAVPHSYGSSGKLIFIMSENGSMYKRDPGNTGYFLDPPIQGFQDTNGALHDNYDTFPIDPNSSSGASSIGPWSKLD